MFTALKTLIAGHKEDAQDQRLSGLNYWRIDFIDSFSKWSTIEFILSRKSYVICIDNADYVMKVYPELRNRILNDFSGNYFCWTRRSGYPGINRLLQDT